MESELTTTIRRNVLDKGYVILVDHMGSDLTVVNSARVSFDKRSESLSEADIRLIKFLADHGHTSPFRHAVLQFEVYAPLVVARQWWKYVVGSDHTMDSWNESSRRYITENMEFYIPLEWRSSPENKKQGSGPVLGETESKQLSKMYLDCLTSTTNSYEEALSLGLCQEQARLFTMAYSMYVRFYWTASLQSACHFLSQRLDSHAQHEIREYAKEVSYLVCTVFPESHKHMVKESK